MINLPTPSSYTHTLLRLLLLLNTTLSLPVLASSQNSHDPQPSSQSHYLNTSSKQHPHITKKQELQQNHIPDNISVHSTESELVIQSDYNSQVSDISDNELTIDENTLLPDEVLNLIKKNEIHLSTKNEKRLTQENQKLKQQLAMQSDISNIDKKHNQVLQHEYKKLKQELNTLNVSHHELCNKFNDLNSQNDLLQQQVHYAEKENDKHEPSISLSYSLSNESIHNKNNPTQPKQSIPNVQNLLDEIDRLRGLISIKEEEIDQYKHNIFNLKIDNETLYTECNNLYIKYDQLYQELNRNNDYNQDTQRISTLNTNYTPSSRCVRRVRTQTMTSLSETYTLNHHRTHSQSTVRLTLSPDINQNISPTNRPINMTETENTFLLDSPKSTQLTHTRHRTSSDTAFLTRRSINYNPSLSSEQLNLNDNHPTPPHDEPQNLPMNNTISQPSSTEPKHTTQTIATSPKQQHTPPVNLSVPFTMTLAITLYAITMTIAYMKKKPNRRKYSSTSRKNTTKHHIHSTSKTTSLPH